VGSNNHLSCENAKEYERRFCNDDKLSEVVACTIISNSWFLVLGMHLQDTHDAPTAALICSCMHIGDSLWLAFTGHADL